MKDLTLNNPDKDILNVLLTPGGVSMIISSLCSGEVLRDAVLGVRHYVHNVDSKIVLVVLKDDDSTDFLERLAKELNLRNNIVFINHSDSDKVLAAFLGADSMCLSERKKTAFDVLYKQFSLIPVKAVLTNDITSCNAFSEEDSFVFKNGVFEFPSSDQNFAALYKIIKEKNFLKPQTPDFVRNSAF